MEAKAEVATEAVSQGRADSVRATAGEGFGAAEDKVREVMAVEE